MATDIAHLRSTDDRSTATVRDVTYDLIRAYGLTTIFGIYAFALLASLLVVGALSDHIGRRPVLVAGLLLGHRAPVLQTASSRIAEQLTWRTVGFLLENAVFLLIGLQARWILDDVASSELSGARIAAVCAASGFTIYQYSL